MTTRWSRASIICSSANGYGAGLIKPGPTPGRMCSTTSRCSIIPNESIRRTGCCSPLSSNASRKRQPKASRNLGAIQASPDEIAQTQATGVRRRSIWGGRDTLDHRGPGSRAIPESKACASDVLGDDGFGDPVDNAPVYSRLLKRTGRIVRLTGRTCVGICGIRCLCARSRTC